MGSSVLLKRVKQKCSQFIKRIFPEESLYFEDVWDVLLPVFTKWRKVKPGSRCFRAYGVLEKTGLGFVDARDWSMPIGLMTAVATMLEMWDIHEDITESTVRGTLRKYAGRFGAPKKLQELLEETALPFCLGFYQGMGWDKEYDREVAEKKQQLEAAMPEASTKGDYVVITHKKLAQPLTLQQLAEFKRQHTPKDFFIWIDESQGDVFVNNRPIGLENRPQLRRVLRCLVELRGQRITHEQLVSICTRPGWGYETQVDKLSRGWVIELWKLGAGGGKGKLAELIKSRPGGFIYNGPASFCIIKPAKEHS